VVTQSSAVPGMAPNPEVISAYGHAWKHLWKSFWWLVLMAVIIYAISTVLGFLPIIGGIISLFVTGPLGYGVSYAYLRAARGEQVDINNMFVVFQNYLNVFLAGLLTGLIIGVGFIFLIVPGIYLACKLAFVPYIVVEKKLSATDAISMSWRMTNGYGWQIFLIGLLAIPVFVAGLICLGIGVVISFMLVFMALASLYYAVDSRTATPGPPLPVSS
jgi:uncharacterized membrane protein